MRRKNLNATNVNIRAEEGSENPCSGVYYTLLVKLIGKYKPRLEET
jgi:hypothetical protein